MSLIKSLAALTIQTRTFSSRKFLHPKKFVSILENVPIRPRSAWQIYFSENIGKHMKVDGKVNVTSGAKKVSEAWKALPESEKKIYQQRYLQESKAHYESLEKALNNATPAQFHQENLLRKKYNLTLLKDPRQPKRPKNGFMLYLDHLRATNDPVVTNNEVKVQVVEAAKKYKALSPSEAKIYTDKANAALEQYRIDNAKYKELVNN